MKRLILFLTLVLLTLSTFPARASTSWTVCARGCDFVTIQAGVDAASPGDTLLLAGETFYENVVVTKALTFQGAGADVTIADGDNSGSIFYINGFFTIVIEGLAMAHGL